MKFSYDIPLTISLGPPKPLTVTKIKHGVTEASLSDGRLLHITLHVDSVKPDGDNLDISYSVTTEVIVGRAEQVGRIHETVQ